MKSVSQVAAEIREFALENADKTADSPEAVAAIVLAVDFLEVGFSSLERIAAALENIAAKER